MSAINNKADNVTWTMPASGVSGSQGLFRIAVGTTCVSASIPTIRTVSGTNVIPSDAMLGKFVRALALGSNMDVGLGWGTTGPNLTYGALSTTGSTGILTSSAASAPTLLANSPEHFIIPPRTSPRFNDRLWISAVAQTTGTLAFGVTEGVVSY